MCQPQVEVLGCSQQYRALPLQFTVGWVWVSGGGSRHNKQADKQDDVRVVTRLGTRGMEELLLWTVGDGWPC